MAKYITKVLSTGQHNATPYVVRHSSKKEKENYEKILKKQSPYFVKVRQ